MLVAEHIAVAAYTTTSTKISIQELAELVRRPWPLWRYARRCAAI